MERRTVIGALVSIAAIAAAIAEATTEFHKVHFSWESFAFVIIALIPWLSEFITSLKLGDGNIEVQLREIKQKADAAMDASLRGTGKSPEAMPPGTTKALTAPVAFDDPHKNQFGGDSVRNGRKLTARIERIPNESYYRRVVLRVESTDPTRNPLSGKVTFHLHPTFDTPVFEEPVVDGIAETSIISYGAFTVGAQADQGKTRLELDLASLDDKKDQFFKR